MSTVLAAMIKKNLLDQNNLFAAKGKRNSTQKPVQDLLIEKGHMKEADLFNSARKVSNVPVIDLDQTPVEPALIEMIPLKTARYHGIFPVRVEKGELMLAMSDPCDVVAIDDAHFLTELKIHTLL